jgi:hypothetical protein
MVMVRLIEPPSSQNVVRSLCLLLFSHKIQVRQEIRRFWRIGADFALIEECSCGTHLHAFSATGATGTTSPWLIEFGNDEGVNAPAHHIPDMGTFDLGAYAHATCAKNAAVVVKREPFVRGVNGQRWIAIWQRDMGDTLPLRQGLQFAVVIGHTDRAYVVALGEKQLEYHLAMLVKALCLCAHFHALEYRSHTGWQELIAAPYLNDTHPARANICQSIQMTESRNVNVELARDFQDCLSTARANFLFVNDERLYVHGLTHALASKATMPSFAEPR